MYEQFFGLEEAPFTLTPNTHFYLKSKTHEQGLELLLFALRNNEGFIKVTGEVGTGKTLLCRKLLNAIEYEYVTAYIPNPCFSAETLYGIVANELSANDDDTIEVKGDYALVDRHMIALQNINERLISHAKAGKRVVLIIDEAQSMPEDTLEALRLLTNLETEHSKLLQVVLFGQPELDVTLDKNHLRQLKQRITFQHTLAPFDRGDMERYISHRVIMAGYRGGRLFDKDAISLLMVASGGIPRLINILCHKALLSAYGKGERLITKYHMKQAIKDTASAKRVTRRWLSFGLSAVMATAVLGLEGYFGMSAVI